MAKNTPPGPGVDASGQAVTDPTANVLDLVKAESRRQDDLRESESVHIREIMALERVCSKELREAEANRIDAIREVDVGNVQRAAETAEVRATTLQTQVVTTADAFATRLRTELDPIIESIADLRRNMYEGVGRLNQDTEQGISSRAVMGIVIAAVGVLTAMFVGFLTLVGLAVTIYFATAH